MVPTLARRVYANRFAARGKTFFHLYNATGKDYSGPVLNVVKPAKHHVFDMLNCKELAAEGSTPTVAISLKNDDVACIAILPALLEAKLVKATSSHFDQISSMPQKLAVSVRTAAPCCSRISGTGKTRLTFPSFQKQEHHHRLSSNSLTPTGC